MSLDLRTGRAEEAARLARELVEATPADHAERARHTQLLERSLSGDRAAAPPEEEAVEGG